jgi:D-alanyl-D-alanine dipeptidase
VPLLESGEPLVDLRAHCPGVKIARRCLPFLRVTAAELLNRAAELLPAGHTFLVRTALRTIEIQSRLYEGYFKQMQEAHPEWSHATLRRATNRFFAPADQKAPPGHCTGGAVDVHLLLPGGRRADLSSPYQGWSGAPTFIAGLTDRARRNRKIIYDAMTGVGFSNCRDEFWHYSYGDSAWAVRTGSPICYYGLAPPPASWRGRR